MMPGAVYAINCTDCTNVSGRPGFQDICAHVSGEVLAEPDLCNQWLKKSGNPSHDPHVAATGLPSFLPTGSTPTAAIRHSIPAPVKASV